MKNTSIFNSDSSAFIIAEEVQKINDKSSEIRRGNHNKLNNLTAGITTTYKTCNPEFRALNVLPQRILTNPSEGVHNNGLDNSDANLICRVHDTFVSGEKIFTVLDSLGVGTFGQVFRCRNEQTKEIVAVKVIKNKPAYYTQGLLEIKIATLMNNTYDPSDEKHIVRLIESFEHKNHICLVFELLSMSLLDVLTQNQFRGLPLSVVQRFTKQILVALVALQDANVIHCDLKPENILLNPPAVKKDRSDAKTGKIDSAQGSSAAPMPAPSSQGPSDIKVIDFGSACFEGRTIYSYIQSRFYRSPEVLLGMPYNGAIDMWSLACVCAEMYLGLPLFPGVSQHNQLSRIVEMLGSPPDFLVECKHGGKYFTTASTTTAVEPATDAQQQQRKSNHKSSGSDNLGVVSGKYRLKTAEEFAADTNTEVPVLKRYLRYSQLEEVILKCPLGNKSRLTTDQKNAEMMRRRSFLDFLRGLFNLNPFDRWTAQQAVFHPFILNMPFTGTPYQPAVDLKAKERRLVYIYQNKQSLASSQSASASAVSSLGGTRAPTNFGGNVSSTAMPHHFAPLQSSNRRLSEPVDSVGAKHRYETQQQLHAQQLQHSSSGKAPPPVKEEEDRFAESRPSLKRGGPVHAKDALLESGEQQQESGRAVPQVPASSSRIDIPQTNAPPPPSSPTSSRRHRYNSNFSAPQQQQTQRQHTARHHNADHLQQQGQYGSYGSYGSHGSHGSQSGSPAQQQRIFSYQQPASAPMQQLHQQFVPQYAVQQAQPYDQQQMPAQYQPVYAGPYATQQHVSASLPMQQLQQNWQQQYLLQQQQQFALQQQVQAQQQYQMAAMQQQVSTSLGGVYGMGGSMQESAGMMVMTDFGLALLRPDMDEQRRLLSQNTPSSSGAYSLQQIQQMQQMQLLQQQQQSMQMQGHVYHQAPLHFQQPQTHEGSPSTSQHNAAYQVHQRQSAAQSLDHHNMGAWQQHQNNRHTSQQPSSSVSQPQQSNVPSKNPAVAPSSSAASSVSISIPVQLAAAQQEQVLAYSLATSVGGPGSVTSNINYSNQWEHTHIAAASLSRSMNANTIQQQQNSSRHNSNASKIASSFTATDDEDNEEAEGATVDSSDVSSPLTAGTDKTSSRRNSESSAGSAPAVVRKSAMTKSTSTSNTDGVATAATDALEDWDPFFETDD